MLYVATEEEEPLSTTPEFSIEELDAPTDAAIRPWFSLPHVRFIGSHTGCSCGFPSFIAEEPLEYCDGFFDDASSRTNDLKSVRELLALIRKHARNGHQVEMFPVWITDEGCAPKGTIELNIDLLQPETFFFNEQFFYRITGGFP